MDSILAQTYRNLELLLMDDGSEEPIALACDVIAVRDSRCRVLHQSNAGVSAARNAGMAEATGAFLMFVDADDTLPDSALVNMVRLAEDERLDMVCGAHATIWPRNRRNVLFDGLQPGEFTLLSNDQCSAFARYVFSHQSQIGIPNGVFRGMGAKLFRRALVADLSFDPRIPIMEDSVFVAEAAMHSQRIGLANSVAYEYRMNNASAMHSMSEGPWIELEVQALAEHAEAMGLPEEDACSIVCQLFLYVADSVAASTVHAAARLRTLRHRPCFERAFDGLRCTRESVGAKRYFKLMLAAHGLCAAFATYTHTKNLLKSLIGGTVAHV